MEGIQERLKDKSNPYNTFGKDNFLNANTGEEVRMVTENWDSPLSSGGVSIPLSMDENSVFQLYIKYLPEQLTLESLSLEMFGDNPKLIDKYYKKTYMVQSHRLAKLPTETLEFLIRKYNYESSL